MSVKKEFDLKRMKSLLQSYKQCCGKDWDTIQRLYNCPDVETRLKLKEMYNSLARLHGEPLLEE